MKNRFFKKRAGVATTIILGILTLVLFAALYFPLNMAITTFETIDNAHYSSYFDPNTYSFMTSAWNWLPIVAFFMVLATIIIVSQKRGYADVY